MPSASKLGVATRTAPVAPATAVHRSSNVPRRRRHLYIPAFSVLALATVLLLIGVASHWGGSSFSAAMTNLRVVLVGPVTLTMLAVFLVVERLRPAQRRSFMARGYRHDVLYVVLNATIVAPLVVALTLSFSEVARRSLPWVVVPRLGMVPHWFIIGLIFVAMDGCNWLAHLANHHIQMLWRFHELHHSQEDMSVLTVFRTHPLIHVSYLITLLPGIILISNGTIPTILLVVYAGIVAFEHSNTNLSFGPLGRVLVSPNYHRLHHRLVGRQDINLGFALTIWDQMSRRAIFPTADTVAIDTGLPGRPLRVEQSGERARHFTVLVHQLVSPFRPLEEPAIAPSGSEHRA